MSKPTKTTPQEFGLLVHKHTQALLEGVSIEKQLNMDFLELNKQAVALAQAELIERRLERDPCHICGKKENTTNTGGHVYLCEEHLAEAEKDAGEEIEIKPWNA